MMMVMAGDEAMFSAKTRQSEILRILREQKVEIFRSFLERIEKGTEGDKSLSVTTFHKESVSVLYHLFLKYLSHRDNEIIRNYLISLHISGLGGQIAFTAWLVQRIFKESLFANPALAQFEQEILSTLGGLEDVLFKFLAERIAEDERKLANLKKGNLIALQISEAISQSKNLDDLLENFLDRILHMLKIDQINIFLFEKDMGLVLRGSGECLPERPLRILIHDSHLYRHVRHSVRRSRSHFLGMRLHIPLQDQERMIGFLEIIFRSFPKISKEDLDLYNLIGFQLGAGIKNIQLQEEIALLQDQLEAKERDIASLSLTFTSLSKELYALSSIFTKISQSMELDDMLSKCAEKILEIFIAEFVSIFLIDEKSKALVLQVERGRRGIPSEGGIIIQMGEGTIGKVAQEGRPISKKVSSDSLLWLKDRGFQEGQEIKIVGVPLSSRKSLLGVLCLFWEGERVVIPGEVRLLSGLANLMGMGIENSRLYAESIDREVLLEEKIRERTKDLEVSEERYRNLVENAKDIIFQIDRNNSFLFINKAVKDLTGFSSDELVGIHGKPLQLIHKEDREKVLRETIRVLKGEILISKDLEYRHLCKDGREIWVSQTTYPIRDSNGHIIGVEGVARDVTENKKLLKEIFDAKVLLEGIFNGITDGIVLLDSDFQIITCNKGAEKFFNLPMNEMKERKYLDLIGERTDCCQCIRSKNDLKRMHTGPHLWKGSEVKVVNLFWFPVMEENGVAFQMINYLQDITVVTETQEELEKSRRLALLGELSAGVAHQIRNPLGNITMGIKLLRNHFLEGNYSVRPSSVVRKEVGVGVNNEIDPIFEDLLSGADYLNRVVTNLLHYTKTFKPIRVEAHIHPIIEGVLFFLKENLDKKYIKVVKKFTPSLPPILVDPSLLEQALHNLIQNAIEAMSNHGTLTIMTLWSGKGTSIGIKISDTGTGISGRDIPKLFHPFFTRKENGVGLGLAIAQKMVEAHGGMILAESRAERGSTFTISLPLNQIESNGFPKEGED
jgi:PAS domain S-box-containing protein